MGIHFLVHNSEAEKLYICLFLNLHIFKYNIQTCSLKDKAEIFKFAKQIFKAKFLYLRAKMLLFRL